jgi:hypothetical protein
VQLAANEIPNALTKSAPLGRWLTLRWLGRVGIRGRAWRGCICGLVKRFAGYIARNGTWGGEDIVAQVVVAKGVGERGAVAGGCEGLSRLAGGAGALVLVFNGKVVVVGSGVAMTQAVGKGWFIKRN